MIKEIESNDIGISTNNHRNIIMLECDRRRPLATFY